VLDGRIYIAEVKGTESGFVMKRCSSYPFLFGYNGSQNYRTGFDP
jgi:hypothetical protein